MSNFEIKNPQCTKQLLVEGEVDLYFLIFAVFADMGIGLEDIEVRHHYGKDNFSRYIESFVDAFQDDVDVIGVLRDADEDGNAAFNSVCGAIRDFGKCFPEPKDNRIFESLDGKHSGVMIIPDIGSTGYLETLIMDAVKGKDCYSPCVEEFSRCVYRCREKIPAGEIIADISHKDAKYTDKVKFYSYLATQDVSGGLMKTAAESGCLHIDDAVYQPLKEFIRLMLPL